jgi:hypothetical protein
VLLLGIEFPPAVLVAQERTSGQITVEKPTVLSTDRIDCGRVPLGAADYKPCVVQLPSGESLLTAFHQHKKDGGEVLEQTLLFGRRRLISGASSPPRLPAPVTMAL